MQYDKAWHWKSYRYFGSLKRKKWTSQMNKQTLKLKGFEMNKQLKVLKNGRH